MRSTFKLLFYINRNKVKSDGTTAVLCRISIDGKKSAVATGIYCRPEDWDSKKCEIRTVRENNRLAGFRDQLEKAYDNLLKHQGVVTAELLKATVSGANSVPEYLLQAGEVERERLRIRSAEINSTSTYRQSKTTQLNLRQFIESRGMKDIAFSDITEEFAESFKVFLKKELGYRNSHVNHCLCWLNRLIYIAVDREILRANPIEDVAYEKKEPLKLRHISRGELKRMMETPLPVRDVLWYEVHGMGVALGMKENLSYHMARHSFGTLMLSSGIPIESIAKMMGHTNINSTQVYAQVTDRKISGDMDQLMKRRQKGDTVLLTEMSE